MRWLGNTWGKFSMTSFYSLFKEIWLLWRWLSLHGPWSSTIFPSENCYKHLSGYFVWKRIMWITCRSTMSRQEACGLFFQIFLHQSMSLGGIFVLSLIVFIFFLLGLVMSCMMALSCHNKNDITKPRTFLCTHKRDCSFGCIHYYYFWAEWELARESSTNSCSCISYALDYAKQGRNILLACCSRVQNAVKNSKSVGFH